MASPVIYPGLQPFLQIWDGLPGSGKSYSLAQAQVAWLEAGHPVISNLEIKAMPFRVLKFMHPVRGEFTLLTDEELHYQELSAAEKKAGAEPKDPEFLEIINDVKKRNPGKHILLVIDELPDYYPTETYREHPAVVKEFLRKHRHLDVSIIVTAQSYDMIAPVFRKLAGRFRHHKNLVNDPVLSIILWWFSDNFHMAYSVTGVRGVPVKKDIFDRRYFRINKKTVAKTYDTTQMHGTDLVGGIRKAKSKAIRYVAGAVLLVIVLFAIKLAGMVVWPERPAKKAPEVVVKAPELIMDSVQVESVRRVGEMLEIAVLGKSGKRILWLPYEEDSAWSWHAAAVAADKVQVPAPVNSSRPMSGVIKELQEANNAVSK